MFNVFVFVLIFSLLFTVALLFITCLCILCKRKQRKTRDLREAQQAAAAMSAGRTHPRPSLANLCGNDVEVGIEEVTSEGDLRRPHRPAPPPPTGRSNLAFESDTSTFPPEYAEALKSKYSKVYSIYPSLGTLRRIAAPSSLEYSQQLPPAPSTSTLISSPTSSSPNTSFDTVESRYETLETPPPPYDLAVRVINSIGHL